MRAHQGIMFGWESTPGTFGFDRPQKPNAQPVNYDNDGPICCIAPTGAGKGRSLIVPLLLTYTGPVIALDVKGELSAVSRRAAPRWGTGSP